MLDRPTEPHSTGEEPEEWALIAEWEAQRADNAEQMVAKLQEEITYLRKCINGD